MMLGIYQGLFSLINDIKVRVNWEIESKVWTMSFELEERGGIYRIKIIWGKYYRPSYETGLISYHIFININFKK